MVLDVDQCRWSCCVFDRRSSSLSNRLIRLEQRGLIVALGLSFLVTRVGTQYEMRKAFKDNFIVQVGHMK